jgi:hypothetical protein
MKKAEHMESACKEQNSLQNPKTDDRKKEGRKTHF